MRISALGCMGSPASMPIHGGDGAQKKFFGLCPNRLLALQLRLPESGRWQRQDWESAVQPSCFEGGLGSPGRPAGDCALV